VCGLAGYLNRSILAEEWPALLTAMSNAVLHRGPDDVGHWFDASVGIGLGHRRLSIIDLSPLGHQPMMSGSGRYVIVYNGEVYNFKEIRVELEALGHRFRGNADTEVIIEGVQAWGVENTAKRLIGMFAFTIWDRQTRTLSLVRDRLGIKPLYYGQVGRGFAFASELKSLFAIPEFDNQINRNALALFLRHGYVPAPYSIYKGIHKLLPGHVLTLQADESSLRPLSVPFWNLDDVVTQGLYKPFQGTDEEASNELNALLSDAVGRRMVADVPLGAFLSGGIDSSATVALMQAQSSTPIKTFTIGFHESGYNEAEYAKTIARHLGTDHTELYVTPEEALQVIPRLPTLYDEPFADSSQIPTFLVSELARRYVTVSLSGDGGDEVFGGYTRYFLGQRVWNMLNLCPTTFRNWSADFLLRIGHQKNGYIAEIINNWLPVRYRLSHPADKISKLSDIISCATREELYLRLVSGWKQPDEIVINGKESPTLLSAPPRNFLLQNFTQYMMYLDTLTYLPDDILVKVDRASMGVGLEARVPMLDHRVLEFAWRLPLHMKVRNGEGKWILRQILQRYVPKALIERPKMGFGVPIDSWLKGPLRDWAEHLLEDSRLRQEGFFSSPPIRSIWKDHLDGKVNGQAQLWYILMFQAWFENIKNTITSNSATAIETPLL
jgi:asparagine synthase (glutamine-hydrolysing)